MALRPWRSPGIVVEGEQTGDGRYIVEGAVTWVDPPLPLALLERQQHGDLVDGGVTVGTIDGLTRDEGGRIAAFGMIDDEIPEAAEAIRRMEAGTAPSGNRWPVSIDPDDYAVELILNTDDEDDAEVVILAAAGTARHGWENLHPARALAAAAGRPVRAAAGDGDPAEEGEVLFEDSVDQLVARFTRLRIRGATMCAIAAFSGSYIELEAVEASSSGEEPVAAAVRAAAYATAQPAAWYRDPGFDAPTPLTIDDDGYVFGHVAAWDVCHTGYLDRCVTAPRNGSYRSFLTGTEHTDEGRTACGVLTWGIPHADLSADLIDAQQHYADSRAGWAHVTAGEDDHGLWVAGSVLPGLTADDVRILRGLSLSGDWRWSLTERELVLIAALAVNYPGFPIPRSLSAAGRAVAAGGPPQVWMEDTGQVMALVAAGTVAPLGAPCGCQEATLDHTTDPHLVELLDLTRKLDLRTRHLIPEAVAAAAARLPEG